MARVRSALIEAVSRLSSAEEFVIVELTMKGAVPVENGGRILTFATGKAAAQAAQQMSTRERKFQPRRIKDDDWQDREVSRFKSGEYHHLPWSEEKWWKSHTAIHSAHFPHVSTKNSIGLMAFTESPDKGSADLQTALKPGRYLERYFADILDTFSIRDLCTEFSNKFEDNCLLMAETEDEFETIYTTGPSSCMSHDLTHYSSHVHPVRAYAHASGDLKLGYMKKNGRITARALIHTGKKRYNNIYGDKGVFEPLLQKAGLKPGAPSGAKMARILTWEDKKNKKGQQAFVLPHIDGINWVYDRGDHLEVGDPNSTRPSSGTYAMAGAAGLSEWVSFQCPCCSQAGAITGSQQVTVSASGSRARWCASCVEKNTIQCVDVKGLPNVLASIKVKDQCVVEMANGAYWWMGYFKDYGFVCARSGKNHPSTDRVAVKLANGKIELWSKAAAHDTTEQCKTCKKTIQKGICNFDCVEKYTQQHLERERLINSGGYSSLMSATTSTGTSSGGGGINGSSDWFMEPPRRR